MCVKHKVVTECGENLQLGSDRKGYGINIVGLGARMVTEFASGISYG